MKKFNDASPWQTSTRLADVFEVAHRIRRLGIRDVVVNDELEIHFHDHRLRADVMLTPEPWFANQCGWFWYARIMLPNGFSMGPVGRGRWVLYSPAPRQVVRAYQEEARSWWGRLPVKRSS